MTRLFLTLVLLAVAVPTQAAIYYVRTDGNNGNAGTTNSAGGAWLTIDYAADHVSAGDTVRVQAGTYAERVTPGVNGTSGNPITFVADGTVTMCGWDISGASYLRVIGFVIDTDAGGCSINNGCVTLSGTNSYLEFWHNTFQDATYDGVRLAATDLVSNSLIIGNLFQNFGVGNGSGVAMRIWGGADNLIAYNELSNSHPDGVFMMGVRNRWLNNYTHDFSEASGGHSDVFQVGSSASGWSTNLIEANFQAGMGTLGDEHTTQISHAQAANCGGACGAMTENIFRRNVWHNVSSYPVGINQTTAGDITNTRHYHNTTADARVAAAQADVLYGLTWTGANTNGWLLNNIEHDSWGSSASANLVVYSVEGALVADYNLAYDPDGAVTFAASPWTNQGHEQSNADPAFANFAGDDFTLGVGSAAIGNAGPLTTVASANGTGTTFSVATNGGGFFRGPNANISQYGGALTVGDVITVGTDVRRVASISGDAITVTESLTWAQNDPVFFGDDTTPDIGAYPYKAGGYSLSATFAQVGSDVTITPNDPALVRFAVCFVDGIPVAVDAVAPFSCTVGAGSVSARVYPLFASTILWADATAGPAPATNPVVR
jgi:hypothetical protein